MTVKEYLESTYKPDDAYHVRNGIKCEDGFTVSVQGGTPFHYCTPRELCNVYTLVELGFPNEADDTLTEYAEDPEDPTGTVYAGVPIDVVEALIEKHGGIK